MAGNSGYIGQDRRAGKRFGVQRDSKVFRRATQRYSPARTCDLSTGGALLEIASERPFNVGEIVDVGIAYSAAPVVRDQAMLQGVVIRADSLGAARQRVAVRYVRTDDLARAA